MEFYNLVNFFVETNKVEEDKLKEITKQLGVDYSTVSEDGYDYYKFTVKRRNHFSMSNGTSTKIKLNEPGISVEDYVEWINNIVDNII